MGVLPFHEFVVQPLFKLQTQFSLFLCRLLLSPVRVGAEALSWAAKKLEPNKIGLATSPSTTAVQDRVLQAAAKHESKPSDAEESSAKTDSSASEA